MAPPMSEWVWGVSSEAFPALRGATLVFNGVGAVQWLSWEKVNSSSLKIKKWEGRARETAQEESVWHTSLRNWIVSTHVKSGYGDTCL